MAPKSKKAWSSEEIAHLILLIRIYGYNPALIRLKDEEEYGFVLIARSHYVNAIKDRARQIEFEYLM